MMSKAWAAFAVSAVAFSSWMGLTASPALGAPAEDSGDPVTQAADTSGQTNPEAKPVEGKNEQYVETDATERWNPNSYTGNGDGYNPIFVRNSAGDQIVWSLTHHADNDQAGDVKPEYGENVRCQFVKSKTWCTSKTDVLSEFGANYQTQQNNHGVSDGTMGYAPVIRDGEPTRYVAPFDFADMKDEEGSTPQAKKPVKIIDQKGVESNRNGWFSTSLFKSGDKLYMVAKISSTEMAVGCFDPKTGQACSNWGSEGKRVTTESGSGNKQVFAEAALPGGKYTASTEGGDVYCVKPDDEHGLVNCDGSTTVKSLKKPGAARAVVPIVNSDGDGFVKNEGENSERVTGFCTGFFGKDRGNPNGAATYSDECFTLDGSSLGNAHPKLPMPKQSWARNGDGFAYPSGQAQVIYSSFYSWLGQDEKEGSLGTCYDFDKKSLCAEGDNASGVPLPEGTTFRDIQKFDDKLVAGKIYGAKMIPNTTNCMVTLGDNGQFLYWKVEENGAVKASDDCSTPMASFLDQSSRYCEGAQAITAWGNTRVRMVDAQGKEVSGANKLKLEYLEYDPETKNVGKKLGETTTGASGSTDTEGIADPSAFLKYPGTKNFTIRVVPFDASADPVTFQITQEHKSEATAEADCSIDVAKKFSDVVDNGDGTHTVKYVVTVTNKDEKQKYTLDDKADFADGVKIESWTVKAGADTPAVEPAIEAAPYTGPANIVKDREILPKAVHTYEVAFKVSGVSDVKKELRECASEGEREGHGFFNQAILNPGDSQKTGEDCGPIPGKTGLSLKKYINGDDAQKAPGVAVDTDGTMDIKYVVTNTGEVDLTGVKVTDKVTVAADDTAKSDMQKAIDAELAKVEPFDLKAGESKDVVITVNTPNNAEEQHTDVAVADGKTVETPGSNVDPDTPVKSNDDPGNAHTPKKPEEPTPTPTPTPPGETPPPGEPTPTPTPEPEPEKPEFAVKKDAVDKVAQLDGEGNWKVSYRVTVSNVGSVDGRSAAVVDEPNVPAGFTVTDIQADGKSVGTGKFTLSDGVDLKAGESKSFTVVVSGTADVDAVDWSVAGVCDTDGAGDPSKGLFNKVTMDRDSDGPDNNDACVPPGKPGVPGVSLVKKINGFDAGADDSVVVREGSDLDVTYVVENTGSTVLDDVKVTDDVVDSSVIKAPSVKYSADGKEAGAFEGSLKPGEYAVFTATIKAPKAGTHHKNVGTVEGTPPPGTDVPGDGGDCPEGKVCDSDDGHADTPKLSLKKYINGDDAQDVPGVAVKPGEDMEIKYVVKNDGKVDLRDVKVTDKVTAGQDTGAMQKAIDAELAKVEPFDLKAGESKDVVITVKAPAAAGDQHTNVAVSEGTPPSNGDPGPGKPGEPVPPGDGDVPPVKSNDDPGNAHTPKKPEEPTPTPTPPGDMPPGDTPPAPGNPEPGEPGKPGPGKPLPRTGVEIGAGLALAAGLLTLGGFLITTSRKKKS